METTFYKYQLDQDYGRSYEDMVASALTMIHLALRPNKYKTTTMSAVSYLEWDDWHECIHRTIFGQTKRSCFSNAVCGQSRKLNKRSADSCRKSAGFDNKYIPASLKYNPDITAETRKNALNAFEFLMIYEALFYSKNVIRKYLKKIGANEPSMINVIVNNVFEIDYDYDVEKDSYPGADGIIHMIAETVVNTVVEQAPVKSVMYDEESDLISAIVHSDDVDLLKKSIKNITLGGGRRRSARKTSKLNRRK
jgi:hypothetical protein